MKKKGFVIGFLFLLFRTFPAWADVSEYVHEYKLKDKCFVMVTTISSSYGSSTVEYTCEEWEKIVQEKVKQLKGQIALENQIYQARLASEAAAKAAIFIPIINKMLKTYAVDKELETISSFGDKYKYYPDLIAKAFKSLTLKVKTFGEMKSLFEAAYFSQLYDNRVMIHLKEAFDLGIKYNDAMVSSNWSYKKLQDTCGIGVWVFYSQASLSDDENKHLGIAFADKKGIYPEGLRSYASESAIQSGMAENDVCGII